jgi:hypothetical protein
LEEKRRGMGRDACCESFSDSIDPLRSRIGVVRIWEHSIKENGIELKLMSLLRSKKNITGVLLI